MLLELLSATTSPSDEEQGIKAMLQAGAHRIEGREEWLTEDESARFDYLMAHRPTRKITPWIAAAAVLAGACLVPWIRWAKEPQSQQGFLYHILGLGLAVQEILGQSQQAFPLLCRHLYVRFCRDLYRYNASAAECYAIFGIHSPKKGIADSTSKCKFTKSFRRSTLLELRN